MLIVFNPTAGRGRHRRLHQAIALLRTHGVAVDVAETAHPGHATALARTAAAGGCRLVVAAGGDGTIAEVAAGLDGSGARLGILPLGTANVLAWELGLPPSPAAAARVLLEGAPRLLRPGLARFADGSRRLFVQMLGAGFDAAVVHRLDPACKRRLGRGAYVLEGVRQLARYPFPRFTVVLDDQPEEVVSAIVSKGRLYAGRHLLAPAARAGEPGFQVALFTRGGPFPAALYGAALPLDLLPRLPGVTLRPAARVRMAGGGVPVQADGDAAGVLPVEVTDAPHAIAVLLPR